MPRWRIGGRMGGTYDRENERERAYNSPESDSQSKPCPDCDGAGCYNCRGGGGGDGNGSGGSSGGGNGGDGGDGGNGSGGGGGNGGGGGGGGRGGGGGGGCSDIEIVVGCLLLIIFLVYLGINFAWGTEKISVVKFQVGSLALSRSLQSNINRIAEGADTSTREGSSSVLTETTLALIRHPDYCISVYSSVDIYRSREDSMNHFNQLSFEERAKFNEETLVNVNNIKSQTTTIQRDSGFGKEYLVITILVAAEGVHKLPTISGKKDLKKALQKLGTIPSNKPLAVEVLWTPQNENDTLSKQELLENYPLLRSL